MRYARRVREIVFWRWIFGLALALVALMVWSGFVVISYDPSLGAPVLAFVLEALIVYGFSVLFVFVLAFLAMIVWDLACNAWDFFLDLIGLGD